MCDTVPLWMGVWAMGIFTVTIAVAIFVVFYALFSKGK